MIFFKVMLQMWLDPSRWDKLVEKLKQVRELAKYVTYAFDKFLTVIAKKNLNLMLDEEGSDIFMCMGIMVPDRQNETRIIKYDCNYVLAQPPESQVRQIVF